MHDAEDLVEAGVHPGAIERHAVLLAGLLDDLGPGTAVGRGVVGVAVVAGDPVGGGDDVDAGFQDAHVEILVGKDAVEGQHIGLGGDDLLDRAGGDNPDRADPGDLPGVATDLLRRVAVQADQFQVAVAADAGDHLGADIAGGHLENADLFIGFAPLNHVPSG